MKIGNLEMFLSFFAAAFPRKDKDQIIALHEKLSDSFELDLEPLVRFVFSRMGMSQNQITKVSSFRRAIQGLKERYAGKPKEIGLILQRSATAIGVVLDLLRHNLGVASSQFVPSQNALLTLFDFAVARGFASAKDIPAKTRRRMQYWFLLRGRTGKEYLMLLDVLLHRNHATDWAGKDVASEDAAVHHIFPREFLKDGGERRDEYINCIGNLTFIDPSVNSEIGDTAPAEYFKDYRDSALFERHMISDDPKLWTFDTYEKFLDTRLKLLWAKTKEMLEELTS